MSRFLKSLHDIRGGVSGALAFGNATGAGRLTGSAPLARRSNGCQLHPGPDSMEGGGEYQDYRVDEEKDGDECSVAKLHPYNEGWSKSWVVMDCTPHGL